MDNIKNHIRQVFKNQQKKGPLTVSKSHRHLLRILENDKRLFRVNNVRKEYLFCPKNNLILNLQLKKLGHHRL
ncbi:hypothetical protein D0463_16025 [Bacillus sp. V59.32b]|nr:hypothetical protein D0463_16025 [Bacillus sp. V59.32b]